MAELVVPGEAVGRRLDLWLRDAIPELSRARLQGLIRSGRVVVDGEAVRPGHVLRGGEAVSVTVPDAVPAAMEAEAIPLEVLYEDADLIAVNKPAGLVVHPAPGHARGTLVNALLHHCSDLAGVGGELRPGIVHRLDRDTSGVIVAAKNELALRGLQAQFKERTVQKRYLALVRGCPAPRSGTIDAAIGRSPRDRKKMSISAPRGRNAVSHYEVEELFPGAARVAIRIDTGRTHQIRVHLASIGHPVLGDTVYGGKPPVGLPAASRQMLHAHRLELTHPSRGIPLAVTAPLPRDVIDLMAVLRG